MNGLSQREYWICICWFTSVLLSCHYAVYAVHAVHDVGPSTCTVLLKHAYLNRTGYISISAACTSRICRKTWAYSPEGYRYIFTAKIPSRFVPFLGYSERPTLYCVLLYALCVKMYQNMPLSGDKTQNKATRVSVWQRLCGRRWKRRVKCKGSNNVR